MSKCMIVDESLLIKLLVRYNGIGPQITNDEREILLFALYNESEARDGLAMKASQECEKIAKQRLKKEN